MTKLDKFTLVEVLKLLRERRRVPVRQRRRLLEDMRDKFGERFREAERVEMLGEGAPERGL